MRASLLLVLIAALGAAGCGGDNESAHVAIAEGVYDATVVRNGIASETIGSVSRSEGISVFLALGTDASVTFGGPLDEDGTLESSGFFLITDVVVQSRVEATFSESAGVTTVSGTVFPTGTLLAGFEHPITFTMTRPLGADVGAFAGIYRFTLEPSPTECACVSTLDLTVTMDALGNGFASATTELRADGSAVASLSVASVELSPQGRLVVGFSYAEAPGVIPGVAKLIGTVDAAAVPTTASGDIFFGFTPATRIGSWRAVRIG